MGDSRGFLKIKREEGGYRPVNERINDYSEVEQQLPENARRLQASRCMDCGVPFCNWACPVANIMPEWQDLLFKGDWKSAYDILAETNNFPEFTGRVCPAPCEASCVLSINDDSVTIRQNELSVIEKAFSEGYVRANPPEKRTEKKVAVVGSGPAGLACADMLNRAGHTVTVIESADNVGGYLRYGIPDFKLDKRIIDRRVDLLKEEGIFFRTHSVAGKSITTDSLLGEYDAICLAIGARKARDVMIDGREFMGIHMAMDFLVQLNHIVRGDHIHEEDLMKALNKNVLVIGGGDTGSDCVGSANRQGAKKVTQIEMMPVPSKKRSDMEPWPLWPRILKTSSSHEEGCERMWEVMPKRFIGGSGWVKKVQCIRVRWELDANGSMTMREIPGTEFEIDADMVIIAAGFQHIEKDGIVKELGLDLTSAGNIAVDDNMMTSRKGIFAAGDASRGASLVVWAIHEGRKAAGGINTYLGNMK